MTTTCSSGTGAARSVSPWESASCAGSAPPPADTVGSKPVSWFSPQPVDYSALVSAASLSGFSDGVLDKLIDSAERVYLQSVRLMAMRGSGSPVVASCVDNPGTDALGLMPSVRPYSPTPFEPASRHSKGYREGTSFGAYQFSSRGSHVSSSSSCSAVSATGKCYLDLAAGGHRRALQKELEFWPTVVQILAAPAVRYDVGKIRTTALELVQPGRCHVVPAGPGTRSTLVCLSVFIVTHSRRLNVNSTSWEGSLLHAIVYGASFRRDSSTGGSLPFDVRVGGVREPSVLGLLASPRSCCCGDLCNCSHCAGPGDTSVSYGCYEPVDVEYVCSVGVVAETVASGLFAARHLVFTPVVIKVLFGPTARDLWTVTLRCGSWRVHIVAHHTGPVPPEKPDLVMVTRSGVSALAMHVRSFVCDLCGHIVNFCHCLSGRYTSAVGYRPPAELRFADVGEPVRLTVGAALEFATQAVESGGKDMQPACLSGRVDYAFAMALSHKLGNVSVWCGAEGLDETRLSSRPSGAFRRCTSVFSRFLRTAYGDGFLVTTSHLDYDTTHQRTEVNFVSPCGGKVVLVSDTQDLRLFLSDGRVCRGPVAVTYAGCVRFQFLTSHKVDHMVFTFVGGTSRIPPAPSSHQVSGLGVFWTSCAFVHEGRLATFVSREGPGESLFVVASTRAVVGALTAAGVVGVMTVHEVQGLGSAARVVYVESVGDGGFLVVSGHGR